DACDLIVCEGTVGYDQVPARRRLHRSRTSHRAIIMNIAVGNCSNAAVVATGQDSRTAEGTRRVSAGQLEILKCQLERALGKRSVEDTIICCRSNCCGTGSTGDCGVEVCAAAHDDFKRTHAERVSSQCGWNIYLYGAGATVRGHGVGLDDGST